MQLEVLVEEPSAEAALKIVLPKLLSSAGRDDVPFAIHNFSGKSNLLKRLPSRLEGFSHYADAADLRILVLVDRDSDDCLVLKGELERMAAGAGLETRATSGGAAFRVCNRIVVEELEAWFLGDSDAVRAAYPRVPASFHNRKTFRDPDGVAGGTWQALERLLQKSGYHQGGLAKVQCASDIASHMVAPRNRSPSFRSFAEGVVDLVNS